MRTYLLAIALLAAVGGAFAVAGTTHACGDCVDTAEFLDDDVEPAWVGCGISLDCLR